MKLLKYLLILIGILVALFLIAGLFLPKTFSIERSITIQAPKQGVMQQVQYLKNLNQWAPWIEADSTATISYEGEDGQVGAISTWDGNDKVGKGKMEITRITKNRVESEITFIEPYEAVRTNYFLLENDGENNTELTWGFQEKSPYPFNVFMLFYDIEEAVRERFEKGLNNLKERCENPGKSSQSTGEYEIREFNLPHLEFFGKKDTVSFDELSNFFSNNYHKIYQSLASARLQPSGHPSALYFSWDEQNSQAIVSAVLPFKPGNAPSLRGFEKFELDSGKAVKIAYYGAYDQSGKAHESIDQYMQDNHLDLRGPVIEEYVTDPSNEPDTSQWLTNIVYPVK